MNDFITERELNLALKPVTDDVAEIKADVKAILNRAWLGPRGRNAVAKTGLIVGGAIATVVFGALVAWIF